MGQVIGHLWDQLVKLLGILKTSSLIEQPAVAPIAVNYHFSRKCNYACGFCFHTATTSNKLPLEKAKDMISQLAQAGCKKLNFAGGEPFLPDHTGKDNYLGEMVKHAKLCGFESVSIISNARYVKEEWIAKHAQYLDILGVSCDSANDSTNDTIGRGKDSRHTEHIKRAAALCHKYKIMFKLNTVVNSFNHEEDMSALVNEIRPMRWKLFQVLAVEGENQNNGRGAKRDVAEFLITKEQFDAYVERHKLSIAKPEIMKEEDNDTMQSSYVLVDENGCFLDCSTGSKLPTKPILEVGVQAAWRELTKSAGGGFDQRAFLRRDGQYAWTNTQHCAAGGAAVDIEDLGKM
jgi:radical S-adenosyl methionine domain-containing protein 2